MQRSRQCLENFFTHAAANRVKDRRERFHGTLCICLSVEQSRKRQKIDISERTKIYSAQKRSDSLAQYISLNTNTKTPIP